MQTPLKPQPLPAQSRLTVPASTSSQQTRVWAAPSPVHHGGSLLLLTWCPESACTFELLPGCLGRWPPNTSHQEEASPASSPSPFLPPSPSPWPLTTMLEFSHTSASRAAPHPHPWGPAASRAWLSGLSPLLSPGPSHFPSPSAPSSSFQPEERFYLPSLTQRDFLVGLGSSWWGVGGGALGQLYIPHTNSPYTWPPLQRRVGLDPGRLG